MMPFYGLEEQELINEIQHGAEENKFNLKQRKTSRTIKNS